MDAPRMKSRRVQKNCSILVCVALLIIVILVCIVCTVHTVCRRAVLNYPFSCLLPNFDFLQESHSFMADLINCNLITPALIKLPLVIGSLTIVFVFLPPQATVCLWLEWLMWT